MPGSLYQYLAHDHDRLDTLLRQAVVNAGAVEPGPYQEFRKGLLRHISIEEKIVFPTIARLQGGRPAPIAARLRLDHGAIVSLLVPVPSASIIKTLQLILSVHNPLEEQTDGVYQLFDSLAGSDSARLLDELESAPEVPVLSNKPLKDVVGAVRRAVARAGYTFQEVED